MTNVPFLQPRFPSPEDIAEDYRAIVASGIFTNGGPKERAFAAATAAWIGGGVRTTLTSSASSGLQLAGAATFLPGRRWVIVPSFTFAAGPLAARWCGFDPLFVDLERETWQADLGAVESVLEQEAGDIAGILLTASFGVPVDCIDRWEALSREYGLPLVIDMAAGFGSCYASGERAGGRGTCEVFSFHATKTLAIGEGGLVASRDHSLIARLDRTKNFGFDAHRCVQELATNAKLPELACAIGLRQLGVLPQRLLRRHAVFDRYVECLAPLGIEFQPGSAFSALPFVSALLPSRQDRDAAVRLLDGAGIASRVYYNPPVHEHPLFAAARREGALDVTAEVAGRIISLPMADDLKDEVVDRIAASLVEILGRG